MLKDFPSSRLILTYDAKGLNSLLKKYSNVNLYTETILIVDNDENTKQILERRLTKLGYRLFFATTTKHAFEIFCQEQPDLVILELKLDRSDGLELSCLIREHSQTPIIILTSLKARANLLLGFEIGADDYLTKPFFPKELEMRMRSVLRRSISVRPVQQIKRESAQKIFKFGNTIVDLNKQEIWKGNLKITLTTLEWKILNLLIDNAGVELSRQLILDNVWGYTPSRDIDTRIVDVHISRLRAKLEVTPTNPDLILTVRGVGYTFQNYL